MDASDFWGIVGIVFAIQSLTAGVIIGSMFWITNKISKDEENHERIIRNQKLIEFQLNSLQSLAQEFHRSSMYFHYQICQYSTGDFNQGAKNHLMEVSKDCERSIKTIVNQIQLFSSDDDRRIDAARQLSQDYYDPDSIEMLSTLIKDKELKPDVKREFKYALSSLQLVLRDALSARSKHKG